MTVNLTNPIFHDENKARDHFEKIRWPNGPYCPHCGNADPEEDDHQTHQQNLTVRACISARSAVSSLP